MRSRALCGAVLVWAACGGGDVGDGSSQAAGTNGGNGGQQGTGATGSSGAGTGGGANGSGPSTGPTPESPAPSEEAPIKAVSIEGAKVVGSGNAASCTEAAFDAQLAGGGTIVFDCGAEPVTIKLTSTKKIKDSTALDGGDKVTLTGDKKVRLFEVDSGDFNKHDLTLTLQHITLREGSTVGRSDLKKLAGGAAVYLFGANLHAIGASFLGNQCPIEGEDVAGGAVFNVGLGEVIAVDSVFADNACASGGALGALGSALTVHNCVLSRNQATGKSGDPGTGGNGGAISMDGENRVLRIEKSRLENNFGNALGGAVFRTSYHSEDTVIDRSTFDGNGTKDYGPDAQVPSGAGAIYLQGSHVAITASTIANNTSGAPGAGIVIHNHGDAQGILDITNSTLFNNDLAPRPNFEQRSIGGALFMGDGTTGTLKNVTIAGNGAQFASAIAGASVLTILNSILVAEADNVWTPITCSGSMYDKPPGKGARNLQWPKAMTDTSDMACAEDVTRADPMLGELADNGGPTFTIKPSAQGPAAGKGQDCPDTDQRGVKRKAACTLGAYELE